MQRLAVSEEGHLWFFWWEVSKSMIRYGHIAIGQEKCVDSMCKEEPSSHSDHLQPWVMGCVASGGTLPPLLGQCHRLNSTTGGTWKLVRNAGLQVCHKTYWIKIGFFTQSHAIWRNWSWGKTAPCDITRSFWEESSSESNIAPFTAAWAEARERSQDLELSLPDFQTSLLLVVKYWRPRVRYLNSWAFALPPGQWG